MSLEAKDIEQHIEQIRDERREGANTAKRVGSTMMEIFKYVASAVESAAWNIAKGFLRKDQNDETTHKLTMGAAEVKGNAAVKGNFTLGPDGTYSISKEGIATLAGAVLDYIKSHDFHAGTGKGFDGTGFGLTKNTSGKYTMELDNLIVRMKMIIAELEVHEMTFIGGSVVLSPCGNRIDIVKGFNKAGEDVTKEGVTDKTVSYYRCYFLANDGEREVKNEWSVGQLARCKTNNITKAGTYKDYQNQDYWRLCVGVSDSPAAIENKEYHWFELSNETGAVTLTVKENGAGKTYIVEIGGVRHETDKETGAVTTSDSIPAAGDKVIGLGHAWDAERQNAAIFLATGNIGWTLYKGIRTYSLDDNYIVNKFSVGETIVTTDHYLLRPYAQPSETTTVVCMRGAYDATKSYGHNDLVAYNGQVYICLVKVGDSVTGIAPDNPTDGAKNWAVYTAKGADGKDGKDGKSARRTAIVSVTSNKGTVFNDSYRGVILKCNVMIDGKRMGGKIPSTNFTWTKDGKAITQNGAKRYRTASSPDAIDRWKCSVKIPKRLLEPIELTAIRVEGNNLIFRASEDITGMKLYPCWKRHYKIKDLSAYKNQWGFHDMHHDKLKHHIAALSFVTIGNKEYSVDMSALLMFVAAENIVMHKTQKVPTAKCALRHGSHTYWLKQGDDGKYRAWGRYGVMLADGNMTPISTVAKCRIYVETDSDTATTGRAVLSV